MRHIRLLPLLTALLLALPMGGCATPFRDASHTPLAAVTDNYLSLYSGIPGLLGLTASAVIIGDGLAVTNAHVAEASNDIQGLTSDGRAVDIRVLAVSRNLDLAFLAVPRRLGHPLRVADAQPRQTVWAMGTTDGLLPPVAQGRIVNIHGWSCSQDLARPDGTCAGPLQRGLMVEAPGGSGYSGGPLVGADGALLGIVQGTFTRLVTAQGTPVGSSQTVLFAYPTATVLAEAWRLVPERAAQSGLPARPALARADPAAIQPAGIQ